MDENSAEAWPPTLKFETSNQSPPDSTKDEDLAAMEKPRKLSTFFEWGKIKLRKDNDEGEEDWWFASTAIPLLAATLGPMANVTSIAALVSYWRMDLRNLNDPTDPHPLKELYGRPYPDPHWAYDLNIASLVCGFAGNIFLLFNFTNRIRYIIALPMTIVLWYMASGLLIGITTAMNTYVPPNRPFQAYTSAFWQGVIAAVLYLVCAMILGINMLGYFLGHYTQHFNLTESQRTLILQTMMFFIWLAGGAAIFQVIEKDESGVYWNFSNSLYFCDVTILTVGFGDLVPTNNVGRGVLFPYSVGGIIMLGLVISSISTFASELSYDHVIRRRLQTQRERKLKRSTTLPLQGLDPEKPSTPRLSVSAPFDGRVARTPVIQHSSEEQTDDQATTQSNTQSGTRMFRVVKNVMSLNPRNRKPHKDRLVVLQKEKDRFDAMREVQQNTDKFRKWTSLTVSVTVFAILWCVGAIVFWQAEKDQQQMSYFEALYFCYVSLLTIGYGDFAPVSSAGRPFFILWSLLAVPSMTILISNMGDTIISTFKEWTSVLADFTVLPKHGIWRGFLEKNPWLLLRLQKRAEKHAAAHRVQEGFPEGPEEEQEFNRTMSIQQLATESRNDHDMAKRLAWAIKRTAKDFKGAKKIQYSYEEWAEFTELIKFTSVDSSERVDDEDEGLIEWDWIGEDSPMMTTQTEPEWLLDRLCESMSRYVKRKVPKPVHVPPPTTSGPSVAKRQWSRAIELAQTEGIGPQDHDPLSAVAEDEE